MHIGESDPVLPIDDMTVKVSDHVSLDSSGKPQLNGGHCQSCGIKFFPTRTFCPKCTSSKVASVALPTAGELYTYSSVHISATKPTPYHLGYIDLPGDVRLLAELKGELGSFNCGDQMSLVSEGEGKEWFFEKTGGES